MNDEHSREKLARELGGGRQVEAVVERADERDDARAEQHAMPQLVILPIPGRKPHERRDEGACEDREPPQERRRAI